jgi:hypothetical protein
MLQQRTQGAEGDIDDEEDDEEQSLVDLMDADADLEMRGGGRVHSLDDYRPDAAAAPRRPPPSLHELVQHYVTAGLDTDPIGGLLYLCSFDWPGTEHTAQWMMLLPRIAALYRERAAQREAEAAKARSSGSGGGNVHGIAHASTVGRFQRSSASSAVRAASSATLPANVRTLDQYDIDLRARGVLPADWIPRGLDDIWSASSQYGVEEVMTLLRALGQGEDEVETTRCYVLVLQQLAEEQKRMQEAQMAALQAMLDPTGASAAAAAPSSAAAAGGTSATTSPFTSPATSRTSSYSRQGSSGGGGGNIATLSSLRSSAPAATSPSKPAVRSWGSGHSLLPAGAASTATAAPATASVAAAATGPSAASATNPASPAAASSSAASSSSTAPTSAPHPDVQSLFPLDANAPSTKLQLVLAGVPGSSPPPVVLTLNLSRTLGDVRAAVAAASGFAAEAFDLVIPRPRQLLPSKDDAKTIQQLRLQSAKIQQVLTTNNK